MALTYAPAGRIGSELPAFRSNDVEGKPWASAESPPGPLVVMFLCGHCPYVLAIEDRLIALARAYRGRAGFVAVCSNDASDHAEDRPEALRLRAREKAYPFPYLVDESQGVARALGAVCTPDLFIYDPARRLAYRGRLDDAWRDERNVRSPELRRALDRVLAGGAPEGPQVPSMGCSIKWKAP